MPASITVERVEREGRKIHVYFSDGTSHEFASRRLAREAVDAALRDERAVDLLKMIAVSRGLRVTQDADDADDLDLLTGRTLSFNRNAVQNILRIT